LAAGRESVALDSAAVLSARAEAAANNPNTSANDLVRIKEIDAELPRAKAALAAAQRDADVKEAETVTRQSFLDLADAIDAKGGTPSPEQLKAWYNHTAQLRTARVIGVSHQVVTLNTDRLIGPAHGYRPLKAHTWGAVARGWASREPATAA
jgi:hypothetical protein